MFSIRDYLNKFFLYKADLKQVVKWENCKKWEKENTLNFDLNSMPTLIMNQVIYGYSMQN